MKTFEIKRGRSASKEARVLPLKLVVEGNVTEIGEASVAHRDPAKQSMFYWNGKASVTLVNPAGEEEVVEFGYCGLLKDADGNVTDKINPLTSSTHVQRELTAFLKGYADQGYELHSSYSPAPKTETKQEEQAKSEDAPEQEQAPATEPEAEAKPQGKGSKGGKGNRK